MTSHFFQVRIVVKNEYAPKLTEMYDAAYPNDDVSVWPSPSWMMISKKLMYLGGPPTGYTEFILDFKHARDFRDALAGTHLVNFLEAAVEYHMADMNVKL